MATFKVQVSSLTPIHRVGVGFPEGRKRFFTGISEAPNIYESQKFAQRAVARATHISDSVGQVLVHADAPDDSQFSSTHILEYMMSTE